MRSYEEKLTIVQRFRGLQFDRKSMRMISRTIKDYSQKHVDPPSTKRRSIALSKRGSSQLSTAVKVPWQSTRGSLADTTLHLTSSGKSRQELSPFRTEQSAGWHHQRSMLTIKISLPDLNPQVEDQQLASLESSHRKCLKESKRNYSMVLPVKISSVMRATLVDWLMEVSQELQLTKQTFYSAVDYVDRVMQLQPVPKSSYQLLGIACLSLATKLQMQNGPKFRLFQEALDGSCSKHDLINMEERVLTLLKFRMNPPTLYHHMMADLKLLQSFRLKQYMVVPDLFDQKHYEQYRQLAALLDLLLLNADHLQYDRQRLVLALLYLFFRRVKKLPECGANKVVKHCKASKKPPTNRLESEMAKFIQEVCGIEPASLSSQISFLGRVMQFRQAQPAPRGGLRAVHPNQCQKCHSFRLRLQGYSSELRVFLVGS